MSDLPLSPIDHHHLLVFWCQLVVLLGTARILGLVARRAGQPRVVGELAAGIILGPSVLGRIWPSAVEWLFPADETQSGLLLGAAWIGVLSLVAVAGAEVELRAILHRSRTLVITATGSLLVPLAAGLVLGLLLPSELIGIEGDRAIFAGFLAVALAISSLPVAAKILGEMGYLKHAFGQLVMAVAMVNDVIGWILLGLAVSLTVDDSTSGWQFALTAVGVVVIFAAILTLGPRTVDIVLRESLKRDGGAAASLSIAVLFILVCGLLTHSIGVEAVVGAFAAGVAIGTSRLRSVAALHHLEVVTMAVLAPLFFAIAGLRVDLGGLASPSVAWAAVVVIVVATLAKLIGAGGGARLAGLRRSDSLAVGAGLNARGALEIVVGTIGLSAGILNQDSYTIIVLMALVTSMSTTPLLRLAMSRRHPSDVGREGPVRHAMVDPGTPVLVAAMNHADSEAAVELAGLLWPPDRLRVAGYVRGQAPVLVGGDGVDGKMIASVVTEAVLGHGVAVIADLSGHDHVLSPPYEQIVRQTNLPMLVLRRRPGPRPGWTRLLVPVSGSTTSDAALDVALTAARTSDAQVTVLHAIPPVVPDRSGITFGSRQRRIDYRWQQATTLLDHAQRFGRDAGVETTVRMVSDQSPAGAVATMSARHDLVVLGVRRRAQSAFLGYTADEIVRSGLSDVLLVILPED